MGFLSALGKGLGVVGSVVGAPFTGGASLGAIPAILSAGGNILSNVGSVAGGAAKGAQESRQNDTSNLLALHALNSQNTNAANQNAIARANFGASERDSANRRAMASGLLGGLQDVNIDRPAGSTIPTFNITGGLRPSALSPEMRSALMAQLSQGPLEMPEFREAPDFTMPQAGAGEKILGGTSLVGGLLGAIGQGIGGKRDDNSQVTVDRYAPGPITAPQVPLNRTQVIPEIPSMQNPTVFNAYGGPQRPARRSA